MVTRVQTMKTVSFARLTFALLFTLLLPQAVSAAEVIVINEVLASNNRAFNNDGEFPDCVEIFNTANYATNLHNWRLTDDFTKPSEFIFPPNTIIPARGFLIVYCDGNTNLPLHTKFGLNDKGGGVALFGPGLGLRDSVTYGFQITDRSIGRSPDGSGAYVLCRPTIGGPNATVPTSPNRQNIKINEWLASSETGMEDYFEIYNPETNPISISGWYFSTNAIQASVNNRAVTNLSFLDAGGFLKFNCDAEPDEGPDEMEFRLSSGGGVLNIFGQLRSNILHSVRWTNAQTSVSEGWLPDGNTNNRVSFPGARRTPGDSNFLPIDQIFINEVLAHSDPPLEDAIELYNPTTTNVNIGGWWLSDNKDQYNKFRIPPNTIVPPGGYFVFYEYLGEPGGFNETRGVFPGFSMSSAQGDDVYLFAANASGALTGYRRGVDFPASANGVSWGRYITSSGESDFVPLESRTFGSNVQVDDPTNRLDEFRAGQGAPNSGPLLGPLVVSEVMYHPPDIISQSTNIDNVFDEYVEIYNISTETVFLYDTNEYAYHPQAFTNTWRLRGEIEYEFPRFVSLGPGRSLLVVSDDLTPLQLNAFRSKYNVPGGVQGVQVFHGYRGRLANGNGTVEIERPDPPQPPGRPDAGFIPYIRVDRVRYDDDPPWPPEPDGQRINPLQPNSLGYVLARIKPERYGGDVTNWVAAFPSAGRQIISNSVVLAGNTATISFEGLAGSGYTVQYKDELSAATWTKLQDVQPESTSGRRQVNVAVTPGPKRFYRVVTPIQP